MLPKSTPTFIPMLQTIGFYEYGLVLKIELQSFKQ